MSQIIKPDNPFKDASLYLPFNKMSSSRIASNILKGNMTRGSSKWVKNKFGLLEEVPNDFVGITYKDGENFGYLAEPANTEKLIFSKAFDNAVWGKTRVTVSGGYSDPKGSNEAFLLAEDTSNNTHFLSLASGRPSSDSGEIWTQSWFVKKGTGANAPDIITFSLRTATHGASQWANFNLVTGEFTRIENAVVSAERFSNGWWRVGYTAESINADGSSPVIYFNNNNPNSGRSTSYTGQTDADVFIYGANMKQSPVMESYTETTGSEVTRNADVITKTDAADLIGQSEGRVIFELGSNGGIVSIGEVSGAIPEEGGIVKFEYTENSQKLLINGTIVDEASGTYDWSGMDMIEIGHEDGTVTNIDTTYKMFSIFK